MAYATTSTVCRLTGLSTIQLREWTNRRALIPADIPPAGKGSPARFSWQSVLIIQVAVVLRKRFHIELQSHRTLFTDLKTALDKSSFVALWDMVLVIRSEGDWELAPIGRALHDDAIVVHLNPHLEILASDFAMVEPDRSHGQLSLFPVQEVKSQGKSPVTTPAAGRRQSA